MAVDYITKKGFKRLRFVRNTAYAGIDYGPDYPLDEADVENRYAFQFICSGRAVEVATSAEELVAPGLGKVQTRDPEAQHRDPVTAPGLDTKTAAPAVSKRPRAPRKKKARK